MDKLITQTELAKIVGVSQPYIAKLIKKGILSHCVENRKLKKDYALKAYYSHKRGNASGIMQQVKVEKEFWAAKLLELQFRVEKGEFKEKEIIDKKAENIIVAFRNKMLALPTKAAPALVGLNNEEEIKTIILNYIDEALNELERLKELSA